MYHLQVFRNAVEMVGSPAVLLQMAWESVIALRLGEMEPAAWSENLLSEGTGTACAAKVFALLAILNFQMTEESRRI